ncbi:hypothetical protein HJC23_011531, partial [Cyclotella cryptica]
TILKGINGQIAILNSIGRTVPHEFSSIVQLTLEGPRGFFAKAVRLEIQCKELLGRIAGHLVHLVFGLETDETMGRALLSAVLAAARGIEPFLGLGQLSSRIHGIGWRDFLPSMIDFSLLSYLSHSGLGLKSVLIYDGKK